MVAKSSTLCCESLSYIHSQTWLQDLGSCHPNTVNFEKHCDFTYLNRHYNVVVQTLYFTGVRKVNKDGTKEMYDIEKKINEAVFPGLQGGPHNHQIAAVAVALKQANTQEFKAYQRQVIANAQVLAKEFLAKNYTLVSGK